jgi:GTPase SAR1 family protein
MTIFDLSGDREYMQAIADYLNNIQILLLCYSIVDQDSIQDAEKWISKIPKSNLKDVVGIVVGCKKDLTKASVGSAE